MSKKLKYDLDITTCSKIIELNPSDHKAYNNRGLAYYKTGKYDLAIADFSKAIELNPDFFHAYNNRGIVYMQLGRYDLAIVDYNKAIKLRPGNGMPYNNRGFAFLLMGKYENAETDIKRALEIDPDNIYALNSMAELHSAKNNPEEACKWLRKAIGKGYTNWNYIRTSKTYDNIRNYPCFMSIVREYFHKEQK
jgi:tetratricopeptide (TPR) repeat protein